MTAKVYLAERKNEIRCLDGEISRKRERLTHIRARLVGGTVIPRETPGGGSSGNSTEEKLITLIEMQEEIAEDVERLAKLQRRLADEIKACGDPDVCAVLELRYVDEMEWSRIADRLHYTREGIFKLHRRALEVFEKRMPRL